MMNKITLKILVSIFAIFSLLSFIPANAEDTPDNANVEYAKGVVTKITDELQNETLKKAFGSNQTVQYVDVKVTSGKHKGHILSVENQLTSNPVFDIKVKPGDRVILDIEQSKDSIEAFIADRERLPVLIAIGSLFCLLVLLVGGLKGLNSIVSLIITAASVLFILIPGVLKGYPVLPLTVLISMISILASMFIVGGINLKSLAASIGTMSSLVISGILSLIVISLASLSGLSGNDSVMLWSARPDLNFTGILASAMIIASLGAIMDVGISIASCVNELKNHKPGISRKALISSGMNVGRDIIGAMSNTLILAYIGSAFPLLLLAADAPMIKFLNLNMVATEISSAIIGSIGIVVCVPLTAIAAAYLIQKDSKTLDT